MILFILINVFFVNFVKKNDSYSKKESDYLAIEVIFFWNENHSHKGIIFISDYMSKENENYSHFKFCIFYFLSIIGENTF